MGIDPFWSPFFTDMWVYENDIARGKVIVNKNSQRQKQVKKFLLFLRSVVAAAVQYLLGVEKLC